MSYTPSPDRVNSSTTFNGLVNDGNRNAMTGALGNNIQTQDGAASPKASPLACTTTTQTLTVPARAVSVTINTPTYALDVSEDSTNSVYYQMPAAATQTFEVARQQYVYITSSSTTSSNISFFFKLV